MNPRPKIKDIAEKLGVSPATVSRALTGTGLVAEPTLSRIRDAARALNYRPNVSARNLRTQRSMAVLLVVRDVGNPFYLDILKGVEATARAAGYSVLMGNTENDPDRETEYFDMLRDGHADGMILMTGKLPSKPSYLDDFPSNLPVVIALEVIENTSFPHVQIDNVAAAREAVRHLIGLGHRRIAHISGPVPEIMSLRRRDGYREAMAEAGLAIPAGYEPRGTRPAARSLRCPSRRPRSSLPMTRWRSARSTNCGGSAATCPKTCRSSASTTSTSAKPFIRRSPPSISRAPISAARR
jgi:LacI family repressor for deo operon, udp, cdd, tsx, nupC, and nupG